MQLASMFTVVACDDPVPRAKSACPGRLRRDGTDVAEASELNVETSEPSGLAHPTPKSPLRAASLTH